jgi:acyl-CoA reductase-like NAD-dependent aldehyde dehydrogenase
MRRPLIVLAALLALVVAGCGGGDGDASSSKEDYSKELAQAGQTLQKSFAGISDETGANTSAKQIGDRLDKGATALDAAARKFGAITPPDAAKAAHQKLVEGIKELAGIFRRGAAAARKNDTASLTKALQGLSTSDGVKKITEAQQELKANGITVASSGG